jgi:DNA-directed RNA polymerase subunit RPC12/RpoP
MWKRSIGMLAFTCLIVLFVAARADEPVSTAKPPEIIILSGNPMGSVKFRHRLHTDVREIQCITCHHASRPEHPAQVPQEACRNCHARVAEKPMVTNYKSAFHNADASAGLCINCHTKENAEHKHKLAPVKCTQCHNPANVLPDPTAGR